MVPFQPTPNPEYGPQCPNHHVGLVGLPKPIPRVGVGTCPISKVSFEYEVVTDEEGEQTTLRKDASGRLVQQTQYVVKGDEPKN